MADELTPAADRNGFNTLLLDPEVFPVNGPTTTETTEKQTLWPRPLARKWFLMLFAGTCLLYCSRMAMPICAVTMANTFHWTKIDSGLALGGFFWGYCLTQILGGHASDKVGGERVLFMSASSWALVTAATPLMAKLSSHTVAVMTLARFLLGLLQGVFCPSMVSLCSQRVVGGERDFLMSTIHSGSHFGTVLAGGMGSMLLDHFGWESMFYSIGFLAALWAYTVWKYFLKGEVMSLSISLEMGNSTTWSPPRWLNIFKKSPVWAMVIAHMCASSTFYTLLSWLPMYFQESFPLAPGWVYNIIPWVTAIPSALVGGCLSNHLINQGYDKAVVRKLMQSIAMGVNSIFIMLLTGEAFTSFTSAVFLISAAAGSSTFTSGGVSVNVQDLTPSCAGALYGLMNMMGALMGLVLVSLSGYLIEVTQSWASVFSLVSLVNVTGLVIFLIFGDAHRVDLENQSEIIVI